MLNWLYSAEREGAWTLLLAICLSFPPAVERRSLSGSNLPLVETLCVSARVGDLPDRKLRFLPGRAVCLKKTVLSNTGKLSNIFNCSRPDFPYLRKVPPSPFLPALTLKIFAEICLLAGAGHPLKTGAKTNHRNKIIRAPPQKAFLFPLGFPRHRLQFPTARRYFSSSFKTLINACCGISTLPT